MKLYQCTDHDYHYPVGVASIVVAESREQAFRLLDEELTKRGLRFWEKKEYNLVEVPLDTEQALVLRDGNY